jgi:hypothetical protein
MSKRSFIIAALAVILFIAAIFSVVMDFKPKAEAEFEPEFEPEPETEPEPEPEKKPYNDTTDKEIVVPVSFDEFVLPPEQEKELKTKKTGKNG